MFDNLYQVVKSIRKEIYGYIDVVDKDKFQALKENLMQYCPELIMSEEWNTEIKPQLERLCSLNHVKIMSSPQIIVYTKDSTPGLELRHTISAQNHAIASFSGFVDMVEKNTTEDLGTKVPKYYYIYTLGSNDDLKIARYATLVTPYEIIDAKKKKSL